jgi:serine/threonine protein kinase
MELQGVGGGRYLITREDNRDLKQGYMAVIYRARTADTNTLLALKTIWRIKEAGSLEMENWKKAARQFNHEINTLEKLKNIHGIVQVRDRGQYEELPWYVMEFIEGPDISTGLKGKSLYVQVRILRKLVKALSLAHQKGIVHLDLKPANILLAGGEEPIILDFGISKVVELAWETISMSTGIFGTPRYMAPEQFGNPSKTSTDLHQMDIWAIGVLFYEILVSIHPLGIIEDDTYNQMVHKILHNEVKDLSSFGKEVDRALAEICHRALSKEKSHRYHNAAEMFQDLNQWETANFNKCILLAEEYIGYQHWQEAQKSVLEAHRWSPYHPKIKEYLTRALSGQFKMPLSIEWLEKISPELLSFWLKTRHATPPKSLAKIHYIHNEPPYFIAVDAMRGMPLKEFLTQREAKGGAAILTGAEIVHLIATLQETIIYAHNNNLYLPGLQMDNICCELNAQHVEAFQMWGIGFRGQVPGDTLRAVREIVKASLCDENVALDPQVDELLRQSGSVAEIRRSLEQWVAREQQEDLI